MLPPSLPQDFCQLENAALMQQCEQQLDQLAAERLRSEALSETLKQEQARATALATERDAFQGEVGIDINIGQVLVLASRLRVRNIEEEF